jgi:hypothetical protein
MELVKTPVIVIHRDKSNALSTRSAEFSLNNILKPASKPGQFSSNKI